MARGEASFRGGVSKVGRGIGRGVLVGDRGVVGRLTSKLVGVIGTVTNTRRPLPESNQAAAAECHRPAPARASPRTIPPIPQERSARLVSRRRPRRGQFPPQDSVPSLAAGAAGDEGAAHKPPRRARPLSRRVAAIASSWTAMAATARSRFLGAAWAGRGLLGCSLASILQTASARDPCARTYGHSGWSGTFKIGSNTWASWAAKEARNPRLDLDAAKIVLVKK